MKKYKHIFNNTNKYIEIKNKFQYIRFFCVCVCVCVCNNYMKKKKKINICS